MRVLPVLAPYGIVRVKDFKNAAFQKLLWIVSEKSVSAFMHCLKQNIGWELQLRDYDGRLLYDSSRDRALQSWHWLHCSQSNFHGLRIRAPAGVRGVMCVAIPDMIPHVAFPKDVQSCTGCILEQGG